MGEGDLARVAQTGSSLIRGPDSGEWPVLATAGERWDPPGPAYRTTLPLIEPGGMTTGILALWGPRPLTEQGISLLEALAPLLATQLQSAVELDRLRARAVADALTGLPNRRALLDRLAEEQARFDRYQRPVSLIVVQLENLDQIIAALGPEAGDAVLQRTAAAIKAVVRKVDYAARYGPGKLVVLLPETGLGPAKDVAKRVRTAVATAPLQHEAQQFDVTIAIGISACPEVVKQPEELIDSAEEAREASQRD
jgi:diguanylate cyclase (GGDEF)-like protein